MLLEQNGACCDKNLLVSHTGNPLKPHTAFTRYERLTGKCSHVEQPCGQCQKDQGNDVRPQTIRVRQTYQKDEEREV